MYVTLWFSVYIKCEYETCPWNPAWHVEVCFDHKIKACQDLFADLYTFDDNYVTCPLTLNVCYKITINGIQFTVA